ncbi:hypothetical protein [Paraclostridium sordellii]|uniref:hypothetical protein n=1 Tax=Paraclostridium sordellii TaxID=1505 RepID=UPI00038604DF|nr:hypothetical protein [Paeniclostridium sordellii]AUO31625.1 hypothetical protein [Paeniclostridium sordellii]AUO31719.1 hypothetical protein [Paeniclostridium sordellii]EPZ61094.1 hypothetical protein H476_0290 [[Clostridium] sordellii VPI 9048] [Paeniclostridium sordellii VPI 9048]CEK40066.1 hypothetical protein JGS6382_PCS1300251 (plasmid) [[Clostridium] sordellii] [Paeniclostridium sordellii]
MCQQLKDLENELLYLIKNRNSTLVRSYYIKKQNCIQLLNNKVNPFINEFLYFINSNKFTILYQHDLNVKFKICDKNFNFISIISLTQNNDNEIPFFSSSQLILELNYLVSLKKGYGKFLISNLKSLSNKSNLPIILFCKQDLISYYKQYGFIETNYIDSSSKNILMTYNAH